MLMSIRNHDKHQKKTTQSGKETDKDIFRHGKLSLKKIINSKKKLYAEEKIEENKTFGPKELWRALKFLKTLEFEIVNVGDNLKLKESGTVSFDSKKNANIFCRFFSNLAD